MVRRQAVESIERQKHQMIAALFSNPNWDDEKAEREEHIKKLEKSFNAAIELVYHPERAEKEEKIDWDNPFWQAAKRAQEKQRARLAAAGLSVKQVIERDPKQQRARERSLAEIDQMPA